jgi:ferritin-like metal-binding protein YciE
MTGMSQETQDVFLTGLRNAHGLETQAEQMINRQLERLEHYPQVAQQLRSHLAETQQQQQRLDTLLAQYSTSPSSIKEAAMGFMANLQTLGHAVADDEILKNTFANLAFENFEIASYKSLIAMAETFGQTKAIGLLQQSLQEEERMAKWISDHVADVTKQYCALRASGEKADR